MNKLIPTLLLALPGLVCTAGEGNQAVLSDVQAQVQIIRPIRVERVADLVFGQLVVDSQRGDGVVTLFDIPLLEGAYIWWKHNPGLQPHPARFTVTGEEGYEFNYSATTLMELTRSGEPGTINLEPMVSPNPIAFVGSMENSGTVSTEIIVGGALHIYPGTLPGTYSGAFEVRVSYM